MDLQTATAPPARSMDEIEVRTATTAEEREAIQRFRYSVYVEEMGRYRASADHAGHRLADPEDEWSQLVYATDGRDVIASFRTTWGGDGFSERQIEQYQLAPFLAEIPARHLAVGERTMIAPAWRGTDLFLTVGVAGTGWLDDHEVEVVFGACEPHLLSFYGRYQRPHGTRNINSAESGYLIPLVSLLHGADGVARWTGGQVPHVVEQLLAGTGTVTSPIFLGDDRYVEVVLPQVQTAAVDLFDGLTPEEVASCLRRSHVIDVRTGDQLLKAGGSAHNMFVVLEGELVVARDGRPVATVGSGGLVGEVAHLLDRPRGSDVIALTDGRVLSLSDRTLARLLTEQPTVSATVHANLARHLCARLSGSG